MKRMRALLAICWMLLLLAAIAGCERHNTQKDVIEQVFGSQARFDTVTKAETVTVQRVHYAKNKPRDSNKLASYEHETPITVTPAQAAELKKLLTQPGLYDLDTGSPRTTKSCVVNYGIVATFHSRERAIQVGFCFDCNWLGMFEGAGDNASPIKEEIDFDSIRKELVTLMKAIFPNDREIQALR